MQKGMVVMLWLAGFSGAVFAGSWETTSLRTANGGLVNTGMTRQEVLRELGELQAAKGKTPTRGGRFVYRGRDGIYTLTFSGDRLSRIDVTPDR